MNADTKFKEFSAVTAAVLLALTATALHPDLALLLPRVQPDVVPSPVTHLGLRVSQTVF